jgi:hypothetical protein
MEKIYSVNLWHNQKMLIHRLFLAQGTQEFFNVLVHFFENAKAFYLAKACVLLMRFSGCRVKRLCV